MRRLNGEPFEVEIASFLFLDEGGMATSIMTICDISGLPQAQRAEIESEQRLGFALDAAHIGDWDMDLRTNVARRSLRHDSCFGYTQPVADWGYDTFLSHVIEDDRARVDRCFQRAMATNGDCDVEFRVRWPDGWLHWLWSKGRFYFDGAARPYRVAGIQVDVTERRHAEEVPKANNSCGWPGPRPRAKTRNRNCANATRRRRTCWPRTTRSTVKLQRPCWAPSGWPSTPRWTAAKRWTRRWPLPTIWC